ncbi:MAG: energy-coupling factor ABC transporter permease, partial [Candidatus Margulisiibacteriota bacterium]
IIALSANLFNLAVAGCIGGYYIYSFLIKPLHSRSIAIAISAWASVMLAALMCAIEVGASGTYAMSETIRTMLNTHALIGVGEAILTLLLLQVAVQHMGWELDGYGKK